MTTILERPVGGEQVAVPRLSALLVLLTGIFITTLDFFIVNVAIPATQRDLRAGRGPSTCTGSPWGSGACSGSSSAVC